MTTSHELIDIQKQIEALQKQAADIKNNELQGTIKDILEKMNAFGITLKHLIDEKPSLAATLGAGRPKSSKQVKSKNPVPPKFRGPNGEVWSGRGLTPMWLSTLIEQGNDREKFRVQA